MYWEKPLKIESVGRPLTGSGLTADYNGKDKCINQPSTPAYIGKCVSLVNSVMHPSRCLVTHTAYLHWVLLHLKIYSLVWTYSRVAEVVQKSVRFIKNRTLFSCYTMNSFCPTSFTNPIKIAGVGRGFITLLKDVG